MVTGWYKNDSGDTVNWSFTGEYPSGLDENVGSTGPNIQYHSGGKPTLPMSPRLHLLVYLRRSSNYLFTRPLGTEAFVPISRHIWGDGVDSARRNKPPARDFSDHQGLRKTTFPADGIDDLPIPRDTRGMSIWIQRSELLLVPAM